jgi:hypothetical protein
MKRNRPSRSPPKPPTLRRLETQINAFIEKRWKLPLWILASSLFVYCVSFAATFFYNAPEHVANFDQKSLAFHGDVAANEKLLHITDVLNSAFASVRSVLYNYKAIFQGKNVGDPLDRLRLEQGQDLIRTAQNRISVAEAALSTASFPDAALNNATKALLPDLQNQRNRVDIMSRLYAAALQSDNPSISAAIADLRKDNEQADAIGEAVINRLDNFFQERDRFYEQNKIDISKSTSQYLLFAIYGVLAWAAVIYSAVFIVVVFYAAANELLKPRSSA